MTIKTYSLMAIMTLCSADYANAQRVSYNHDSSKQNQITVMETGAGSLSPELYYMATHNSYKKTAAAKNKQGYRTIASISCYNQVDYAETIDSALTKRTKIEALNLADRSIDLAWLAEGSKITSKLDVFQKNIDRIIPMGGSYEQRKQWLEYYNEYECAIKSIKNYYMPNAQRKKMYLDIYAGLNYKNETLVKQLVSFQTAKETKQLLSSNTNYKLADKTSIILLAKRNWKKASNSKESGGSSNGSIEESE